MIRAMRPVLLSFLLLAVLWGNKQSIAQAPTKFFDESVCDPYPVIDVNVTPIFEEPRIDTSHTLADIRRIYTQPEKVISLHEGVALGLTRYEPVIEFRAPLLKVKLGDGSSCARIEKIDASIGYRNVTIYIAQEIARDSCAMGHVLEHERKHVAVNRGVLVNYVPRIQNKLKEYMQINGVYRGADPDYAESLMREKTEFILKDAARKIMDENRRLQKSVDTPEEYARNSVVCGGRINDIVRKAAPTQQ